MKLFGSTKKKKKKKIDKAKNGENVTSLEVVEVVLVQCNLVDKKNNKSLWFYILSCLITLLLIC